MTDQWDLTGVEKQKRITDVAMLKNFCWKDASGYVKLDYTLCQFNHIYIIFHISVF